MSRALLTPDDTDDIEILFVGNPYKSSTSSSNDDSCQLCGKSLAKLDVNRRQLHYNQHFADSEGSPSSAVVSRLASSPTLPSKGRNIESPKQRRHHSDSMGKGKQSRDTFWYASLDQPPPLNHTPGLIPLIKKALVTSFERNQTRRAVLCYDRIVHIYHEVWDSGWGCGYRNYLMACTALMDQHVQDTYFSLLDSPTGPSIRNLQSLIEEAWDHGYDEEGAAQLKHSLVSKSKWIGTAELHVAYTYRGIPSYLADFDLQGNDPSPLLDWIKEYFSPASETKHNSVEDAWRCAIPVIVTDRMPLILQHNGHSRTIIGYEITKLGQTNLLTFDPSRRVPESIREAALTQLFGHKSDESPSQKGGPAHRFFESIKKPFHGHGKRRASRSPSDSKRTASPVKRFRSGFTASPDTDPEVIVIDSDDDDGEAREDSKGGGARAKPDSRSSREKGKGRALDGGKLAPAEVLRPFRIDQKNLSRRQKYQVLRFTLGDPLEEHEKWTRRIVTSEKIC